MKKQQLGNVTHAFVTSHDDDDGTERRFHCARTDTGKFLITMVTKWPDIEGEAVTRVALTSIGVDLLMAMLDEAKNNMDAWPYQAPAPEKVTA
jgi:hypothetical protein